MSSLIREVMLPAAASVGFLVALAMPPAEAGDDDATTEPVAVLVSASPATSLVVDERRPASSVAAELDRRNPPQRVRQGCQRVERIGKFVIRRCD